MVINLLSYNGIVQPLERVRSYRQFLAYLPLVFFFTLIYCYNIFKELILRDNSLFYSRLSKLDNLSIFSLFNSRSSYHTVAGTYIAGDKNNPKALNPWFVTGFVDFSFLPFQKLLFVKSQPEICTYSWDCDFRGYSSSCIIYLATRNTKFKISTKQFYLSQTCFFSSLRANRALTSEFSVQSISRPIDGLSSDNKSLVVLGKNLTSTVGEKFTLKQLRMVKLASYQHSVIIGLLLSDGWLVFGGARSKNVRLGFKQSANHVSYILFVFNILSHYCSSGIKSRTGNRLGKRIYDLEFFTRTMPCLTELYYFFYIQGVKKIPLNIYELLTPVALAHLIMGDGASRPHGLIICTDSYELVDVVRLMNVLIIRYELDCTLRFHTSTQPRIYIKENSMSKLRAIVESYMCESMKYKLVEGRGKESQMFKDVC